MPPTVTWDEVDPFILFTYAWYLVYACTCIFYMCLFMYLFMRDHCLSPAVTVCTHGELVRHTRPDQHRERRGPLPQPRYHRLLREGRKPEGHGNEPQVVLLCRIIVVLSNLPCRLQSYSLAPKNFLNFSGR